MSRRQKVGLAAGAVVLLLAALVYWLTRPLPVLTVATWAGTYSRAQANAMFRPYGEQKHYDVRIALYDGGLGQLKRMVNSRQYDWDVVDLELPDAVASCRLGMLEHIGAASLPAAANGASAVRDFVPNGIGPCWVGSVVYAQVIAFARSRFHGDEPHTAADFFDLKRFPGPRAMRRASAKGNLERALLADGMDPKDVYDALLTPVGIDRALSKLKSLKSSLVWWDSSSDAVAMLSDGRAVMTTALNGDVFDAIQHKRDIGTIWDRALYELDVFGVPKGNPNRDAALDFVRFATGSGPLARVASWVPYGPARRSALPFVSRNPETHVDMRPFLPTSPENFNTAFPIDDEWWQLHGADIEPRWQIWLVK